jgi:hypothetical protein
LHIMTIVLLGSRVGCRGVGYAAHLKILVRMLPVGLTCVLHGSMRHHAQQQAACGTTRSSKQHARQRAVASSMRHHAQQQAACEATCSSKQHAAPRAAASGTTRSSKQHARPRLSATQIEGTYVISKQNARPEIRDKTMLFRDKTMLFRDKTMLFRDKTMCFRDKIVCGLPLVAFYVDDDPRQSATIRNKNMILSRIVAVAGTACCESLTACCACCCVMRMMWRMVAVCRA